MDITSEELNEAAGKYFKNLTPEQFEIDCEKANVDFYNKVTTNIFTHFWNVFLERTGCNDS